MKSIISFIFWILFVIGYIQCVVKFIRCDFSTETSWKPEVVYGIGVVTGLGSIIGYLDLGK